MALSLYRRHRSECKAGHLHNSYSGELEERKKTWKRCSCPIFVSGTLKKKFRRQSTGQWEWSLARAIAARWDIVGDWKGSETLPPMLPINDYAERITIERAVERFLAHHNASSALGTQRMYRYFLNRMRSFCGHRGYVLIEQWTPVDIREFKASWEVAASTANRNMMMLKSFFEFCLSNEWIDRNPAKLVKEPRGRRDTLKKERTPFSDQELTRMFDACEDEYGKVEGEESWRFRWTGEDLADFISLSVYTGLRISDVSTFHIDRLKSSGECHVRTAKTGKKVYTWLPSGYRPKFASDRKKRTRRIWNIFDGGY